MSERPPRDDPPDGDAPFREARPPTEHAIARRIGLGRVLGKVLGRSREATHVGRFALEHKLGEGGMGVVYAGRDPESAGRVAIKLLEQTDAKARRRFAQEAETLRALQHPRIVRYLDHGVTDEGFDYLVMEWLEGSDLSHSLRFSALSIEDTVRVGLEAGLGLAAAHAAGVLHRDVKPSNLFLVHGDVAEPRIIDFGIARAERAGTRLTSTGAVLGTPSYMAPEQVRGVESVQTDVYALGATLYECLTGQPPFAGEHPGAVLLAVMGDPTPSARAMRPDVPVGLDALIGRMMAKNHRDRPLDMHAVLTELSDLRSMTQARESAPALSLSERAPTLRSDAPRGPDEARADWPLRGRARELAFLRGQLAACEEEGSAGVGLIKGDVGMGKSALLRAFVAELEPRREHMLVVAVACEAAHSGSPFAVLRALIDAARAVTDDDATQSALAHVETLLRSLESGAIQQNLEELTALADRLRLAWFDLLERWIERRALVLVIDDVQWLDLSSLRFLKRVLDFPSERGRLIAMAGRPAPSLDSLERSWLPHAARSLALEPLGTRSASRMLEDRAPHLEGTVRGRLVSRGHGNPGNLTVFLNGLDGKPSSDDSPLDIARSRVSALGLEGRRVLRAASLVGGPFQRDLIAKLVGMDARSPLLDAQLDHLTQQGFLRRRPYASSDGELEIASDLAQHAALELCTDEDLRRAHLEIARFWMKREIANPVVIARHLAQAGADADAAPYYLRAARTALAGEDTGLVDELVGEGLRCADNAEIRGDLEAVGAEGAFWRGDLRAAYATASALAARSPAGSRVQLASCSLAVTTGGQLGENEDVRRILQRVLDQTPSEDSADARLICLCRGVTQLSASSDRETLPLLQAIEAELIERTPGPTALAWAERARVWEHLGSHLGNTERAWLSAHGAHMRAGDARSAAQVHVQMGSFYVWIGDWERARSVLDQAALVARRLGSDYLTRWAAYTNGKLAAETRAFEEVQTRLVAVAAELVNSPRMHAGAYVYLGLAALRHSLFDAAKEAGARAATLHASPVIQLGAKALQLIAQVHSEHEGDALQRAEALESARASVTQLPEFEALIDLSIAEAYARADAREALQRALRAGRDRLLQVGNTLADPVTRSHFFTRPYAHRRLLELTVAELEDGP